MTFRINRPDRAQSEEDAMKATARIYRTVDGELVLEDDPRQAYLVAGVGAVVPVQWREKAAALFAAEPSPDVANDDDTSSADLDDGTSTTGPDDSSTPPADDTSAPGEPDTKAVEQPPNKAAKYDPGDHNVEQVLERLENVDADERAAILAAEQAGRARVTILKAGAPR